jgi:CelD/BcsL family acetyltransferase involved in cellulose biosynthesis
MATPSLPLSVERPQTKAAAVHAVPFMGNPISLEELLACVDQHAASAPTGFQRRSWLGAIMKRLAPVVGAHPECVAVRDTATGALVALFAFEVRREMGIRIARFIDLGVSDYNAPLIIDRSDQSLPRNKALLDCVSRCLTGVDVLLLERIHPGVLTPHPAGLPSRHSGNSLTIIDSVESFVRSRGKKYRKELERSYRVLEAEGAWSFQRAIGHEEVERAYAALEQKQAERHADKADRYALNKPQFSAFYRDILACPTGLAQIFTLTVDGQIIAALLGIEHASTFTLLRIANGGEHWRHVSPGRLIVMETMRHFCAKGVKDFDMGIGDYAFKRGFGMQPVPLVDIVIPVTAFGVPFAAVTRLRTRLRQSRWARRLVDSARA